MSLENWTHSDLDIEEARRTTRKRREANNVKRLHHHAFRCRDAEETRAFYEELLGFPMLAACIEPIDPLTNEEKPYMHLYFELSDGSALAFFDYPAHFQDENFSNVDQFGHHIAMEITGGDAMLDEYRKKLNAAGVETLDLDHGYCHSLYFYDPNGLRVELATNVPITERFFADKYASVNEDMAKWKTLKAKYFAPRAST